MNDVPKLRELIPPARFARCRSRFVVPVILFQNKVRNSSLVRLVCRLCEEMRGREMEEQPGEMGREMWGNGCVQAV